MHPLDGWYPGFGEVEKIRRMSPFVQGFISSAVRENPAFLENYLLPTLSAHDSEGEILSDLQKALYAIECESVGLCGHELGSSWLRNVPRTLGEVQVRVVQKQKDFNKERHAIVLEAKRKAQADLAAAKLAKDKALIAREKKEYRQEISTARHAFQKAKVTKDERKQLLDQLGKAGSGKHWAFFRDQSGALTATQAKTMKSGNFFDKAGDTIGKTVKKYGNVLISVAGVALAPFTGGASLAVAALITTANGVRLKRIAANKAKREAKKGADKMLSQAQQEQAQAGQQMDQFYAQNQKWFIDNLGLTPDKWAQLTFDQKLDILQHGMRGTVPGSAPAGDPSAGAPTAGGGYGTPGGGGGGGGDQGGGAPGAPGSGPEVAHAGMFDSSMLPLLAGGVVLALIFGKPMKGRGRRAKRNPGRRRWRVA